MTYINPPKNCDICKAKITDKFYDGKTLMGAWANMCLGCYCDYGYGADFVTSYVKIDDKFVSTKKRIGD